MIERAESAWAAGDFEGAMDWLGHAERLPFLIDRWSDAHAAFDMGQFDAVAACWPDAWSGAEPDDADPFWLDWWRAVADHASSMDAPPAAWRPVPGRRRIVTVYRGQDPGGTLGISWTLDRHVAEFFSHYAGRGRDRELGEVVRGRVNRWNVLCFIGGDHSRGESELIVDPTDVEVVSVAPHRSTPQWWAAHRRRGAAPAA